ncbi:ABC transporter ATP-binding protein [Paenibacillus turpanensis]|uniref:ABC transporter ATP-binding protein n=1 Tax=Paenibacillus turpanensis TaxID=2689078 RepID=UPI00140D812B|nr:ABC transporter ATP-binding protein [Paenibacillus turpanensis]
MEVQIERISKKYKQKKAISDVNLQLPDGSFTAILGPSGCGKTTLMRCLAGFLETDEGRILFGEQDVTHLPPQKRGTAMVFQNYALWPHMTVFENIAYGLKLRKLPKQVIHDKVMDVLRKVEIDTEDVKRRHPPQYSGGQQQRIALARALVLEPKLLLMDEPLSNLDAKVRQRLRVEIRRLQQELGITAVYVTHDQEEALSMADQVVLMNNGLVEQVGSPEQIYKAPASYFAAQFIGNSNTLLVEKQGAEYLVNRQQLHLDDVGRAASSRENGTYGLVFRSEEAVIRFDGTDVQSITGGASARVIALQAEFKESLFVGSGYRHWVVVEGQNVFIESEQKYTQTGACTLLLPKSSCYLFSNQEMKGAAVIHA